MFCLSHWGPQRNMAYWMDSQSLGCVAQVSYSPCLLFQDSLDAMLQWLLHKHHREEILRAGLCTEGALLLLEMLKATMSQVRAAPHMLRGVLMGRQAQKSQP